jgi:hypothetical protein
MIENRHIHLAEIFERQTLKDKLEDLSRKEGKSSVAAWSVFHFAQGWTVNGCLTTTHP